MVRPCWSSYFYDAPSSGVTSGVLSPVGFTIPLAIFGMLCLQIWTTVCLPFAVTLVDKFSVFSLILFVVCADFVIVFGIVFLFIFAPLFCCEPVCIALNACATGRELERVTVLARLPMIVFALCLEPLSDCLVVILVTFLAHFALCVTLGNVASHTWLACEVM